MRPFVILMSMSARENWIHSSTLGSDPVITYVSSLTHKTGFKIEYFSIRQYKIHMNYYYIYINKPGNQGQV